MSVAMPLPERISQSLQSQFKYRVLSVEFGNGYEQVKPDGINNQYAEYSVSWDNLSSSDRGIVWSALNSAGATEIITWTPPGYASPLKFRMTPEGFTQSYRAGNVFSISCNLKQVF